LQAAEFASSKASRRSSVARPKQAQQSKQQIKQQSRQAEAAVEQWRWSTAVRPPAGQRPTGRAQQEGRGSQAGPQPVGSSKLELETEAGRRPRTDEQVAGRSGEERASRERPSCAVVLRRLCCACGVLRLPRRRNGVG
jgi:hypothetical protein